VTSEDFHETTTVVGSVALALVFGSMVALVAADRAFSQEPVGIVTALQGTAQLTRPTVPTAVGLRFKDGLLIRDILDTQERFPAAHPLRRQEPHHCQGIESA
jgi:hypothetical protein